jgi:TatA/E family protein of Tat protein translocase
MFGGAEILIVVVILALLFGYKYLPALGRSAGKGARELKESVGGMAAEHDVTTESLGRKAGKGMREMRELKDAFSGSATVTAPKPQAATATKSEPESSKAPTPNSDAEASEGSNAPR